MAPKKKRARGGDAVPEAAVQVVGGDARRSALDAAHAALWREGALLDCVVVADGREFGAHRLVLAALSPHMKAAFNSGFSESASARVTLEQMRAAVFEAVLTWMVRACACACSCACACGCACSCMCMCLHAHRHTHPHSRRPASSQVACTDYRRVSFTIGPGP